MECEVHLRLLSIANGLEWFVSFVARIGLSAARTALYEGSNGNGHGQMSASKTQSNAQPHAEERTTLPALLREIAGCTHCAAHLPLGPRPVVRAARTAKLMIIGQAPGTRVHETGIPWNDRSGERLRDWLKIDADTFYDESRVAIMPMGFCYPGVLKNGGDAPPRPECSPLWHDRLWAALPQVELTLLIGQYAQARYLGKARGKTLTETVNRHAEYMEKGFVPLPHPSWRTIGWQKKNPWFEAELLPLLRQRIARALA